MKLAQGRMRELTFVEERHHADNRSAKSRIHCASTC